MAARRIVGRCGLGVLGIGGATVCACGVGAAVSPGFRRSCQFWGAVTPFLLEHKKITWMAQLEGCDDQELDERLSAFHQRTASRAVEIILRLGGIYVKIGQFASTMGAGILKDAYVAALRPLQVLYVGLFTQKFFHGTTVTEGRVLSIFFLPLHFAPLQSLSKQPHIYILDCNPAGRSAAAPAFRGGGDYRGLGGHPDGSVV